MLNIELVRIIAMFMILLIHANMVSLPHPSFQDLESFPLSTFSRYFFESLGIVGVNLFVLISGWFLIHPSSRRFCSFFFQIVFYWGGLSLLFIALNQSEMSILTFMNILFFTKWDWFIKAYIVLMILAPVLNSFIKHSSLELQGKVLVCFFLFSCTYGWVGGASRFYVNGYGPLLFIGLYLLAHFTRHVMDGTNTTSFIYKIASFDKRIDLLIFFVSVLINTTLAIGGLYFNINYFNIVYAYINPITIIGSIFLFLFFSKIYIKESKIIMWAASGSFAVYLLHSQVNVRPLFSIGVNWLYENNQGIICVLLIFSYLVLWYVISALVDMSRRWVWKRVLNIINL